MEGGGVDAKSVSMSIIDKGNRKNCISLAEFNLSRFSSDGGGEHAFVQYYEGTYHPYFQAPNLDWYIINQTYL